MNTALSGFHKFVFAIVAVIAVAFGVGGILTSTAYAYANEIETIQAVPGGYNKEGWSASVSFAAPEAGKPTEFTITADGGTAGSGPYQYKQGFIYRYDTLEGNWAWVYDPSFGVSDQYQDSNVLSYQFAAAGNYRYCFDVRDTVTNLYHSFTVNLTVSGGGFQNVEDRAKQIVAECLPKGTESDYEKALVLHDWILDNVSYDHAYKNAGADKALAGQPVTCEGYHAAYVKLLKYAGLEAGSIRGGYPDNHIWTAVKIDGEWYQIDTTGDDVGDGLSGTITPGFPTREQQMHLLFGLNDEIIGKVYTSHSAPTPGYESNSLANNYFIKTGEINEWSDPVAALVQSKLDVGETSFSVEAPNKDWPQKKYKNIINGLVAYDLTQRSWTVSGSESSRTVHVAYADDVYSVELDPAEVAPGTGEGSGDADKPASGDETGSDKPSVDEGSDSGSSSGSSSDDSSLDEPKPAGVWKNSQGKWWYCHADGSYTCNNWELIDGVWYHFDGSGWMQTGWIKTGGAWYYLAGSGAMVTGWLSQGGAWYYLESSGAMKTGWLLNGGQWYYLMSSGAMATGWYTVGETWYWSDSSGAMGANRWVGDYYLLGSGAMATNRWIERYHVDANGKWDKTR